MKKTNFCREETELTLYHEGKADDQIFKKKGKLTVQGIVF